MSALAPSKDDRGLRVARGWPVAQTAARWAAYLLVPTTFLNFAAYAPQAPFFPLIYVIAAIGLVAAFRRFPVPATIVRIGYFLAAWYLVLLGLEVINGDLGRTPRPLGSNFFVTYFTLFVFPFLCLGLKASEIDFRKFDIAVMLTLPAIAAWCLYQYVFEGIGRPLGFNGLNPIQVGFAASIWSIYLLAAALRSANIDWLRLAAALVGLVPVLLSGSKLAWGCAALGATIVFVLWAQRSKRWAGLLGIAVAAAIGIVAVFNFTSLSSRVEELQGEVLSFQATGDTTGESFGLRFAIAKSGLLAFIERPFTGYGLADIKLAAVTHRPADVADITTLWHMHNEYVAHLVAFGILGAVFLLSVAGLVIFLALRTERTVMRPFGLALAAMFLTFMTAESAFGRSPAYGLIFFSAAMIAAAMPRWRRAGDPPDEAGARTQMGHGEAA